MYGIQLSQEEIKKLKIVSEKILEPVNARVDLLPTGGELVIRWTSDKNVGRRSFIYLIKIESDIGSFENLKSFIGPLNPRNLVKAAWLIAWKLWDQQEDRDKDYSSPLARNLWPKHPNGHSFPDYEKYEKFLETLEK